MYITLTNLNFYINHYESKNIFSFKVNLTGRKVYEDEKLVFNLDPLNYLVPID